MILTSMQNRSFLKLTVGSSIEIEGRTFNFNLLKIQIQVLKLIMILTSMQNI